MDGVATRSRFLPSISYCASVSHAACSRRCIDSCRLLGEGAGTKLLLTSVVGPLITQRFRDGAPFLLLRETPPKEGRGGGVRSVVTTVLILVILNSNTLSPCLTPAFIRTTQGSRCGTGACICLLCFITSNI